MRNRYQKPQHEVFVKAMIEHDDPTKAYSIAYPNVSPASAQAAGSRLYARADIRARIRPALEQKYAAAHEKAMRIAEEAGRLRAEEVCRKRMFLAMVVRCEARKRKAYKTKEGLLIVQEDPSHDTIIRAIELDLRLQDGYSRKDLIEKQFNRILRDLSPSPRHGIVYTAEELMKDEPDVMLLSEPQSRWLSGKLIRLNKTDAGEKTYDHRQQSITNSVACPPHGGGKEEEEKTPSVRQHLITNSEDHAKTISPENQLNQKNQINLRFRQEEKTPDHRQQFITNSEPQIRLNDTDADEKTAQDRQQFITNSVEHEQAVTIENQLNQNNQTNLRFRQAEKTTDHRQQFITNSKLPTILKSINRGSERRKNNVHRQHLISTERSELMSSNEKDIELRINSELIISASVKSA